MEGLFWRLDYNKNEEAEIITVAQRLLPTIRLLKEVAEHPDPDYPEFFLAPVVSDKERRSVRELASAHADELCAGVIVIGIGGSCLGVKAAYEAFKCPRPMLFLEGLHQERREAIRDKIARAAHEGKHYCTVIISKSGTTLETIANFSLLSGVLSEHDSEWLAHTVIITAKNSPLQKYAKKHGIRCFEIPASVSGRYSFFGFVGLVPLALAGFDFEEWHRGAHDMLKLCFQSVVLAKNPAALAAAYAYHSRAHLQVLFAPSSAFGGLGQWWKQMIGESLGKKGAGLVPTTALMSEDFHTVLQSYLDGPLKTFSIFVQENTMGNEEILSQVIKELIPAVSGVRTSKLYRAMINAVKDMYRRKQLPFAEVVFGQVNARTMGMFQMLYTIIAIYLAKLFGVNPFDQPAIEGYKKEVLKHIA